MLDANLQFELESYARNAKVFGVFPAKDGFGVLLILGKDPSVSIGFDTSTLLDFAIQNDRPILQILSVEGQQATLLVQLPLFYSPQGWLTSSGQSNYIHTIGEIQTNTGCYKTLTQRLNEELNHHLDLASCGIILC